MKETQLSDTDTTSPATVSLTEEQLDDFARLLARFVTRGNIESLATHVLGPEAVRQAGNDVGAKTEVFARAVLRALHDAGRIPDVLSVLEQDSHRNSRLMHALNHILQGGRLDSDEALQAFINEYEPFLSVAAMEELTPRVRRTVCAVALGDPHNKIVGTGFLIAPDAVMTNYHVIREFLKTDPQTGDIVADADGKELFFFFDYLSEPAPRLPLNQARHTSICVTAAEGTDWLLWARKNLEHDGTANSPTQVGTEYDYAIVRLARRVGALPVRPSGGVTRGWLPLPTTEIDLLTAQKRIMVFQHPQRSPLVYDIGEYVQPDPSRTRVWYKVNTAHGSSGGAAVDTEGHLFALHNAEVKAEVKGPDGERLKVNQGVRIDLIVKDLRAAAPDVVNVPEPPEDSTLFWSLTDSIDDPRPIIGRREFREKVVDMNAPDAERALVVAGPPASGLQYSVKLLRRTLGTHVPVVVFKPADLQSLKPEEFMRVLVGELGIIVPSGEPMPALPSTENVPRWLRLDLPRWLASHLSRDEQRLKTKYPAWVVIDAVPPPDKRLLWADNLQELVAALAGVHDPGQPWVDVTQLRWLYLTPNAGGLPLTGVKHFVEDLSNYTSYEDDFVECLRLVWHTVDRESPVTDGLARAYAEEIKVVNEERPPADRMALRKALSNGVIRAIKRQLRAGGGN
ncbi:MAG TPA: serine protease [Pyrinomonadaceae bacterium]|nr:serine protease [Pyrinomonadaceae bacterium]